jgi:hypothetical protein
MTYFYKYAKIIKLFSFNLGNITLSHYDDREPERDSVVPFKPIFTDDYNIVSLYSDDLCKKLIDHGREGLFIEAFIGKYNISNSKFNDWISRGDAIYDNIKAAYNISISACIYVWNTRLVNAVDDGEWQAVAQIKAILSELMKLMPTKQYRDGFTDGYNPETQEQKESKKKVEEQVIKLNAMSGTK